MKFSHHDSLMRAELVSARFIDLIKVRFPWVVIGLLGAAFASIIVSKFETSLKENVMLAFFIPIIAYMSDAVGTQTETIFVRALTDLKFNISKYIFREFWVGAFMGSSMGFMAALFAYVLSDSVRIGYIVGFSLFFSMTIAAVLACITPLVLRSFGKDPAVGSGPFTTALQDVVSLTIYFLMSIWIL